MPKGERALREILKDDLLTQINEIWRKGKLYQDAQKGNNIQGALHCKAVETNLAKLIPDTKKEKELKPIDLFILSAAACLHDIGKVADDDAKGWQSDHGKRSMQIILKEYDKLGLDRGQAIAVGYIVSAHGNGRLDQLPRNPIAIGSEEVNVIELAAIFRLADMLDTTYQRAPEILSRIKFPHGNIPSKWRGRQAITGWYLDEQDRIILQAVPQKGDEIDAAYTLKSMMNEDLAKISPHLKVYGYPFELGKFDIGDVFLKSELKAKALLQRPFPGMAFYTKDDAKIFKGRETEIENLLSIIAIWPITILIGESGAGKTSLIYAGLFPKLEMMEWEFVWTRPFDNPTENIKKAIWSAFFEREVDQRKRLLDVMKHAAEKCKPHQLLVVMDQFEDVSNCSVQKILDDFSLDLMAVQTGTIIPSLRILISFREDALVKLNSRLLKRITGSAQQFPSVELERLTREGAKEALLAGLENGGIGLDPRREKGQKPLIEVILDDIQKGDDRLYPPYIQMVAETLCREVDQHNPIISRKIYLEQLEGADNIIARYLINRLNEFGSLRAKAEKVVVSLTTSTGGKAQKSLTELSQETEIAIDELKDIMCKMVDLRMARAVGENRYEIVHDYLGKIVDEELVKEEDRTIKFLEEQLNSFYQSYKVHRTPIVSPPFLAGLYRNRRRIRIDEEKYPLILCTILAGKPGLGWYWLRDLDIERIGEIIKGHLSHGSSGIRQAAVQAFRKIARREDLDQIVELLHDGHSDVRRAAVGAFAKIARREDLDQIVELLHDGHSDVRRAAVGAFAKIARCEDRDQIVELLHDGDSDVRLAAVEALGKIARREDKDQIVELLHDGDWRVRRAAVEALGKIARREDKDQIVELLHDGDSGVRRAAVEAFAKIARREDLDQIVELLHDGDWRVQRAAVEAFAKIVRREDKDQIVELLHDGDWRVQRAGVEAFAKIARREDKDQIVELLHDGDSGVQLAAVGAFAKIARREDLDQIVELLHDGDWRVRWAAVEALGKIARREDKDQIVELLHDGHWRVRWAAVEAFAKIVRREDKDQIVELLHDGDWRVRRAAVEALGKIATREDKDQIVELLHDGDSGVRRAAVEALGKRVEHEVREYLLDLVADKAQGWGEKQTNFLEALSELDKRFYCPYFKEEGV